MCNPSCRCYHFRKTGSSASATSESVTEFTTTTNGIFKPYRTLKEILAPLIRVGIYQGLVIQETRLI